MCFEQKQANVAFLALRPFTQDQEKSLFESFFVHIHFPKYEIHLRKSNGIRSDSFFLDLKTQKLAAISIVSSVGLKQGTVFFIRKSIVGEFYPTLVADMQISSYYVRESQKTSS